MLAVVLAGHVIVGGVLSATVTVNEQLGPELVVQLTVVVPLAKNEPEEGVQVTLPHEPPVVGAGYWTVAPHWVEPGPVFTVWFCGQVIVHPAATGLHSENSEVLLAGSVAVAVKMVWPGGTGKTSGPKLALQVAFVVTTANPRNVWPSPLPRGSQITFEKNSIRKVVLAALLSVPEIVTLPAATGADVITG